MDAGGGGARGGFFLEVEKKDRVIRVLPLNDGGRWRVGRLSKQSELHLHHPTISRRHAVLTLVSARARSAAGAPAEAAGGWGLWVEDLCSRHGTRVNGQALKGGERLQLRAGDSVAFARSKRLYWVRQEGRCARGEQRAEGREGGECCGCGGGGALRGVPPGPLKRSADEGAASRRRRKRARLDTGKENAGDAARAPPQGAAAEPGGKPLCPARRRSAAGVDG